MDIKSKLLAGREKRNCTCQFEEGEESSGRGLGAPCGYRTVPGHLRAVAMPGPACPCCSDARCFPAPLMAEPAMPPLPPASRHVTATGAAKESHGRRCRGGPTGNLSSWCRRWAKPPPGS